MHNTHGFHQKATVFNVALAVKGQRIEAAQEAGDHARGVRRARWTSRIYVADNPYYAVTKKDGTFSIPEVPPGSYTLVAWHAFTGETELPVTVKAKETVQANVELKKK